MDIEKFTHQGYKVSIVVAVVLSAIVVTLTALIGRGTLNLRGALVVVDPTEVTVIAAVEKEKLLEEGVVISGITLLRKKDSQVPGEKASYSYLVNTSDGAKYFAQLKWNGTEKQWSITFENLHGAENGE